MTETEKLIRQTFLELDVFNAAILYVLTEKKIITIKEFNEIREAVKPTIIKLGEDAEIKIKEAMKKDEENIYCKCPENKDGKLGFIRCTKCGKPRKL